MTTRPRPSVWLQMWLAGGLLLACGDTTDAGTETSSESTETGAQAGSSPSKGPAAGRAVAAAGSGAASAQTRDVKVRFGGAVGQLGFSCSTQYEQLGSTKVRAAPGDFRFYVQDLKLVAADGTEVPVKMDTRAPWQTPEVALIDFEDMTGMCHGTPEINEYISGTVPVGDYNGVIFTNGVPEALNHLEQSTLPAPLDLTDMYWAWLSGFRFFVLEFQEVDTGVTVATDADAGVQLPGVGLLHVGSTACRQGEGCKKKNRNVIRLPSFNPDTDMIVADAEPVFVETDLTQDMQCHSSGDLCAPMYQRVGVSWETGDSLQEQQVFHVVSNSAPGVGP